MKRVRSAACVVPVLLAVLCGASFAEDSPARESGGRREQTRIERMKPRQAVRRKARTQAPVELPGRDGPDERHRRQVEGVRDPDRKRQVEGIREKSPRRQVEGVRQR